MEPKKHLLRRIDPAKWTAIFWMAALIALLIPMLVIAVYNHPCTDDFSYGVASARAWQRTGSVFQVISAAADQVSKFYEGWQGTYSAVFLMAIQPSVFEDGLYFLVPYLMLASYLGGTFFLLKVILRNYVGADVWSFWLAALILLVLTVQMVPSAVEAFYWYNGAVFYTFFYGLMLLLVGFLLLYLRAQKRWSQGIYLVLAVILSALVGGGNYTTALLTCVILSLLLLYLAVKRNRRFFGILAVWLIETGGFLISVIAPGNAVRQAAFAGHPSALQAIGQSFQYGFHFAGQWTGLPLVLCLLFLAPFLYRSAVRSNWSFRWPVGVLTLSFCVFCAGFTPPLYAMGDPGPARLLNIQYFAYCLLAVLNLFYCMGWLGRMWQRVLRSMNSDSDAAFSLFFKYAGRHAALFSAAVIIALGGSFCWSDGAEDLTFVSAVHSLTSGEAAEYDRQIKERLLILKDETQPVVTIQELSVQPYLLYFDDVIGDYNDWKNESMRNYYQKEEIQVIPAPNSSDNEAEGDLGGDNGDHM